jgi:hypothetical protein
MRTYAGPIGPYSSIDPKILLKICIFVEDTVISNIDIHEIDPKK